MVCISCGEKTHVYNSRLQKRNNRVWRRRVCLRCDTSFTTEESPNYSKAWAVQDAGSISSFSRDKLLLSVYKSCEHRSTAVGDASDLVDTIINRLFAQSAGGRIWKENISQVAFVILNRFDIAAGMHYRAHHSRPPGSA